MKTFTTLLVFLCGIFYGNSILAHGSQSNTTSTSTGQIDPSIQHQIQQLTTGLNSALVTALKQENQLLQQQQQIHELTQKASEQQSLIHSLKDDVQKLKTLNQTSQQKIKTLEDSLHKVQSENQILRGELNNLTATSETSLQELRLESQITTEIVQKIHIQDQEIKKNVSDSLQSQQNQLRYLSLSLVDIQNETNAQISRLEDQQNQTLKAEIQQLKNTLDVTTKSLNVSISNISTNLGHHVAFTAEFLDTAAYTFTSEQTVKYETVLYQVGGGYDPSTGIFTAPRTGLYIITSTSVAQHHQTFWTKIVINGIEKAGMMAYEGNVNAYQSASNLIVHRLKVGDRVWIKFAYGTHLYASKLENTFSVVMIH